MIFSGYCWYLIAGTFWKMTQGLQGPPSPFLGPASLAALALACMWLWQIERQAGAALVLVAAGPAQPAQPKPDRHAA